MLDFKLERENKRFDAMKIIMRSVVDGHEEPTLFEVALIELAARLDGQKEIAIEQGRQIRLLQSQLSELKEQG
jgi:hypothetical protein